MPQGVSQLLPIVLLLLFAYVVLFRLPRKRAREVSMLQSSLADGDRVMLTSGIFGRVEAITDDKIDIEISPGVVVTVHRGAIGKIVRDVDDDAAEDSDHEDHVATSAEATGSDAGTAGPATDPDAAPLRERSDSDGEPNRGAF